MSAVFSRCVPATGAKAGYVPMISGSSPLKHYRRSTTNKAPRKRTFIAEMTKFNQDNLNTPPGVACVFANNVAMLSGNTCRNEEAFGGDAGNNGRNNIGNGGNNSNNGTNNGGFGGDAPRLSSTILLGQALLGALALTVTVAAFPAHSTAAGAILGSGSRLGSASAASSSAATRPRSKVMHVVTKGGTLVVPLPANAESAPAALFPGAGRGRIMDAPIQLSGPEAAMVDGRQFRVRESMRV